MTLGRTGSAGTRPAPQRARDLLIAQGLTGDEIIASPPPGRTRLAEPDLEPASFQPEFSSLVRRLQAQLGGGRALSVLVAGARDAGLARTYAALQIALGLTPTGRNVVVVDADFARPGLGGLIQDPNAEGLTDMVRFGRTLTALLLQPVPEGPWLLPSGSFPEEEPLPLQGDELRSALYRVAQRCDLALYVAPMVVGDELHPLFSVCDQSIVVGEDDGSSETAALVEAVRELRSRRARLAGVVAYAHGSPKSDLETATRFEPGFLYSPDLPLPETEGPPPFEPVAPAPRELPSKPAFEPPELVLPVSPPAPPPVFAAEVDESAERERRELAASVATRRTSEEARDAGRAVDLDRGEFAFEEDAPPSRWPLFLVVAMLVMIVGFVSWALWNRREKALNAMDDRRAAQVVPPAGEPAAEPTAAGSSTSAESAGTKTPPTSQPGPTPPETPRAMDQRGVEPPATGAAATSPGSSTGLDDRAAAGALPRPEPESVPPSSAPPVTGASPAASEALYAVWVASYKKEAQANVEIRSLRKRGYSGRAVQTDLGDKGIWYRVYAGSYPSKAEAAAARDVLLQLPEYKSFAQVRRLPRD